MPVSAEDLATARTRAEAAEYLRVSLSTIKRLIASQELDVIRPGLGRGRILITERSLLEYANSRVIRADRPTPPKRGKAAR